MEKKPAHVVVIYALCTLYIYAMPLMYKVCVGYREN